MEDDVGIWNHYRDQRKLKALQGNGGHLGRHLENDGFANIRLWMNDLMIYDLLSFYGNGGNFWMPFWK